MTCNLKRILAILLVALFLFPFLFLVMLSFASNWRFPQILPSAIVPANWLTLFSVHSALFQGFALSLVISLAVASTVTALGFVTSRAVATHRWGARLLFFSYLPYIFAPVVYAACIYFFFVKSGMAGSAGGVILGQFLIAYPFSVIFFSGYWSGRLKDMEQLAATLGANPAQAFWRVILPVSKSMLMVCFFQTFLISWFEYGLTTIIGVGRVQTLTVKVYQYINEANPYLAAVASSLLIGPPAILLWFNKTYIFKKPA